MAQHRVDARYRHFRHPSGGHARRRPGPGPVGPELVEQVIDEGAQRAFGPWADAAALEQAAIVLTELDGEQGAASGRAAQALVEQVARLWENGWQPADVVHVARRQWTQRVGRLAAAVVTREARTSHAEERAPAEWREQLAALPTVPAAGPAVLSAWRGSEELTAVQAWQDALRLLGYLRSLRGGLQPLCPPPSQWGRAAAAPRPAPSAAVDAKVLGRVRALLAKAESTDFPEEAEALTAKAQDLMTRHAIDAAVVGAAAGARLAEQVRARRLHVDNPYGEAKVHLLDGVGAANGVRVVWTSAYGIATVVGLPTDLQLVEVLFTSLLVQATRAVSAAAPGHTGVKAFRRAFLLSYAVRIRERLADSQQQAHAAAADVYGTALVPVLQQRSEAVREVFTELFPQVVTKRTSPVDPQGWRAGRAAADEADLGTGGLRRR
ncbi:DUF2786 domain-containing protein [Rhodococcus sp. X156]|uniref:DUF2786 domain-containing protein n=1 Tax=Rhodococcus sp. X156 TaxID=2499145 RepID=UPI000FDAA31B|nr:DUF2786 domain-containing protein [Rhodococcus sp. X156]